MWIRWLEELREEEERISNRERGKEVREEGRGERGRGGERVGEEGKDRSIGRGDNMKIEREGKKEIMRKIRWEK
jgi:hypothetical protein